MANGYTPQVATLHNADAFFFDQVCLQVAPFIAYTIKSHYPLGKASQSGFSQPTAAGGDSDLTHVAGRDDVVEKQPAVESKVSDVGGQVWTPQSHGLKTLRSSEPQETVETKPGSKEVPSRSPGFDAPYLQASVAAFRDYVDKLIGALCSSREEAAELGYAVGQRRWDKSQEKAEDAFVRKARCRRSKMDDPELIAEVERALSEHSQDSSRICFDKNSQSWVPVRTMTRATVSVWHEKDRLRGDMALCTIADNYEAALGAVQATLDRIRRVHLLCGSSKQGHAQGAPSDGRRKKMPGGINAHVFLCF